MKKIFKGTHNDDFKALHDAEEWLKNNGFSNAPLCGDMPVGIMKGDWCIAKWKNLTEYERECLHGTMTSEDFRNTDVIIEIKDEYAQAVQG